MRFHLTTPRCYRTSQILYEIIFQASIKTMNIRKVYEEYQVPKNLQEHMLRVGALASILTDNWLNDDIDRFSIIQACLLHDIAKPMNFDLAKQAQFGMSPAEIDKLEKLQNRLKVRYGTDEHTATVGIIKDLGCNSTTVRIVDNLEWSYIPRVMSANDIESLIAIYCDMRIGLKGILTLDDRLADLKTRAGNEDFEEHAKNGKALEGLISKYVSIEINSITDNEINDLFDGLLKSSLRKGE